MKTLISDYFQTVYKPQKTFQEMIIKDNLYKRSLVFISIPIVCYSLMYIFLTIANGAPSTLTPWLNISKENYYSINRFLLAPSMIICWFTATSFIQVVSRLLGGTGTFEQTLSTISLSISIAMWGALIHDLPMSFLSAVGVIDAKQHEIAMNSPTIFRTILWICYSIYFIAFFILFPISVRVVHKINWIKSITIGSSAFIIFQTIFLIFNR
ncbi:MAG TPA: YIP1 family protein [Ignavibacteriaceae bacterium]|nr:YIP1 family protein [Ignavibacteriaceae bacterium]